MAKRTKKVEVVRGDFDNNPFVKDLKIYFRKFRDGSWITGNEDMIHKLKEVEFEHEQPTSFFGSKADVRKKIAAMSNNAKSLFVWLESELESATDYVRINVKMYTDECGIKSINTYKSAVKELCDNEFLKPHETHKDHYYINPSFWFKGSRLKKYPDKKEQYFTLKEKLKIEEDEKKAKEESQRQTDAGRREVPEGKPL